MTSPSPPPTASAFPDSGQSDSPTSHLPELNLPLSEFVEALYPYATADRRALRRTYFERAMEQLDRAMERHLGTHGTRASALINADDRRNLRRGESDAHPVLRSLKEISPLAQLVELSTPQRSSTHLSRAESARRLSGYCTRSQPRISRMEAFHPENRDEWWDVTLTITFNDPMPSGGRRGTFPPITVKLWPFRHPVQVMVVGPSPEISRLVNGQFYFSFRNTMLSKALIFGDIDEVLRLFNPLFAQTTGVSV